MAGYVYKIYKLDGIRYIVSYKVIAAVSIDCSDSRLHGDLHMYRSSYEMRLQLSFCHSWSMLFIQCYRTMRSSRSYSKSRSVISPLCSSEAVIWLSPHAPSCLQVAISSPPPPNTPQHLRSSSQRTWIKDENTQFYPRAFCFPPPF